jgi:hypothetical protein
VIVPRVNPPAITPHPFYGAWCDYVSRIPRNLIKTVLVFVLVLWEGIDMKSVEDLDVFKLAHQLALKTYSTTKVFPREETDLRG